MTHRYHPGKPLPFCLGLTKDGDWRMFMHARHMRGCSLVSLAFLRTPDAEEREIAVETMSNARGERVVHEVPDHLKAYEEPDGTSWLLEDNRTLKAEIRDLIRFIGRLHEDIDRIHAKYKERTEG